MKIECKTHNVFKNKNVDRDVQFSKSITHCIGFAFRIIAGVLMTSEISVNSPVRE